MSKYFSGKFNLQQQILEIFFLELTETKTNGYYEEETVHVPSQF